MVAEAGMSGSSVPRKLCSPGQGQLTAHGTVVVTCEPGNESLLSRVSQGSGDHVPKLLSAQLSGHVGISLGKCGGRSRVV